MSAAKLPLVYRKMPGGELELQTDFFLGTARRALLEPTDASAASAEGDRTAGSHRLDGLLQTVADDKIRCLQQVRVAPYTCHKALAACQFKMCQGVPST